MTDPAHNDTDLPIVAADLQPEDFRLLLQRIITITMLGGVQEALYKTGTSEKVSNALEIAQNEALVALGYDITSEDDFGRLIADAQKFITAA